MQRRLSRHGTVGGVYVLAGWILQLSDVRAPRRSVPLEAPASGMGESDNWRRTRSRSTSRALAMPQVEQSASMITKVESSVRSATGVRVATLSRARKVKPSAHHVVSARIPSNVRLREALAFLVAHRLEGICRAGSRTTGRRSAAD